MKRREPQLDPELEALLRPGKIARRAPAEVRARALTRARAIVAAGGRIPPATLLRFPAPLAARPRIPVWIALAASVAVVASAAVALRSRPSPLPAPASSRPPSARVMAVEPPLETAVSSHPPTAPPPTPSAAHPSHARGDAPSLSAELDLLSRAQAAYTHADFAGALGVIAEHSRRFPNGHLAEQREALRVRSLQRSGRSDESRRAAAAFRQRFPRSVLLSRLERAESSP